MNSQTLEIAIDSALANVWLTGVTVKAIAREAGFGDLESFHIELSAVEAANNAIEHAYAGRSGRPVRLAITVRDSELEITVSDEGIPMPTPALEMMHSSFFDDPDHCSESGRGLDIITHVMDTVTYTREGPVNTLRMRKHRRIRTHSEVEALSLRAE